MVVMMYKYLTFKDGTQLCYSQLLMSGLARLSVEGFPEEKLQEFEAYLKKHQSELFHAAANRLKESVGSEIC